MSSALASVSITEARLVPTAPAAPAPTNPAQAEATAARLASRLFAQATETDVANGFPSQEFGWLRAAGLLVATLPAQLGEACWVGFRGHAAPTTGPATHWAGQLGGGPRV